MVASIEEFDGSHFKSFTYRWSIIQGKNDDDIPSGIKNKTPYILSFSNKSIAYIL